LDGRIKDLDAKIDHVEKTLKHLRELEAQISSKTTERSTLFRSQQKQYSDLEEEFEGV